jgi:hypothetical protein
MSEDKQTPNPSENPPENYGPSTAHPLYSGVAEDHPAIYVYNDIEDNPIKAPIKFKIVKPTDQASGEMRDQTNDAAINMQYANTFGFPTLAPGPRPRWGRAIICGGAPSIKDHLEEIKELAKDPNNCIFAINWTHTWLIENGIVPKACVFFEIDPEPDTVLLNTHDAVTYFICSHCHKKTFDALRGKRAVLWHSAPNSPPEKVVRDELFADTDTVGGGISTFTRTLTVAMFCGYRHFDLFGCDSSFPDEGKTHADGYETPQDNKTDGLYVYAKCLRTEKVVRFRTMGYLALQVEEFKEYCKQNHGYFSLRVHGDSLLRFVHEQTYPDQYGLAAAAAR